MKIWIAGVPGGGMTGECQRERELNTFWKNRLWSYWWLIESNGKMKTENKVNLFLDSGAFSAATQNAVIDLQEYIDFIKEHEDVITVYANLDVIGDPAATWKNQLRMEKAGLMPMPVYHHGEDVEWLKKYLARGYEYIALGGMVKTPNLPAWLDYIWKDFLTDKSGMPLLKVHGFGMTSLSLMLRYPWHCMTEEDHTVLTKKGWKNLVDLVVGEEILCFHEGKSVWQEIEEIPTFKVVDAELIRLYNRNFDCYVTQNHRWNVSNQNSKNTNWKFKTTEQLCIGDCINRVGIPGDNVFLTCPILTNEQVGILAWFWTDGTIKKRTPKYKTNSIVIYQSDSSNHNKCEIIRKLLIDSGEDYCEYKTKQGIIHFELYGNIANWILKFTSKKEIPIDFINLVTEEQAKLFVDYSILADGTKTALIHRDGFEISGQREYKKNNLDILRILCQMLGIPTSEFTSNIEKSKSIRTSSVDHIYYQQLNKEKIKYSGTLWCVRVSSGAFFTKCRNHIYVTGNSVDSTSWVVTGRLGSIYIPQWKNNQWVYDENSWKIAVSSQSPSSKEAGKHITTISPSQKQIVLNYLKEKGYALGISEFKKEKQTYELKENEKWAQKKPTDKKEMRLVEIIVEPGVSNVYQQRDEMNIIYFLDLEKQMPKWPWPFKTQQILKSFF